MLILHRYFHRNSSRRRREVTHRSRVHEADKKGVNGVVDECPSLHIGQARTEEQHNSQAIWLGREVCAAGELVYAVFRVAPKLCLHNSIQQQDLEEVHQTSSK